ncbi:MAG: hypothetical protein HKM99_05125 [Flavobacteriaceae bacterium]|nr:hypothetical protein [Flavobacteriaceae bacterium]
MSQKTIYIGDEKALFEKKEVEGKLIQFENETYYKISNCDAMRPFFMSIVSDSDHWMFISSNGGLSAGRKNSEFSIFPYYTDDKITESAEITGSKTIIQVHQEDRILLWEPFSDKYAGIYNITRNLYKNTLGNKVVFEEINHDLELTFRYQWNSSDEFGFVKKSSLENNGEKATELVVLDGLQNILPYGVKTYTQNNTSNLVDAYKRHELMADTGIGIFALSAIIVDKAEPSEALKANVAWSLGLDNSKYLLSSLQLAQFRKGEAIVQEHDIKAEKGAYFVHSKLNLNADEIKSWLLITNVNQSISDIKDIAQSIKTDDNIGANVIESIEEGSRGLLKLTASADGIQLTADRLKNLRHFSNTLFNIMRGGIFDDNYNIEKEDFLNYLAKANKDLFDSKQEMLSSLPDQFSHSHLIELVQNDEDARFKRLGYEYLPLKFSRRHGDPSRPWNRFSINMVDDDGSKILDYEGNWRDIFQNWEALAHSYPAFIDSMIHKFVNASTFEGYNPYRVTKDGFDWEIIEEDDPWSYIGYWGDHQIIYLLKFLEFIEDHYPNKLGTYLGEEIFVYANVPYKIKPYRDILNNPKDTIDFDNELHEELMAAKYNLGADGALIKDKEGSIYKANLMEKLLVTTLAKLSNFIPEAGIWMNTQRPEWNDANNALVGNGVSMVTLCYLRRFMVFLNQVVAQTEGEFLISEELVKFFKHVHHTFNLNAELLDGKISDKDRKTILDQLGQAGNDYRTSIYANGFSNAKVALNQTEILDFIAVSNRFLEHTIRANKREDNLYHAYNLMTVENDDEVSISYLPEMLEGQVAVLSSGYLNAEESLNLLNGMKGSAIFRPDQYSYLLYPNKDLPNFTEKNIIAGSLVDSSELLKTLLADKNTDIIEQDTQGNYHFNGNFNNAGSLKDALDEMSSGPYADLVEREYSLLLDIFEEVFNHKAFTGRSGTFFGYEGLGSIYWHMVSKLLLSVYETCDEAFESQADERTIGGLLDHFYEIYEGIGVHKSPELYGAFPTDPYSHTPFTKGAQQPGMTGQVKEDLLSRLGELGVSVSNGEVKFNPKLLLKNEFLTESRAFNYPAIDGELTEITLKKDSLCFLYCLTPVIYELSDRNWIRIYSSESNYEELDGKILNRKFSSKLFSRSGEIYKIVVGVVIS